MHFGAITYEYPGTEHAIFCKETSRGVDDIPYCAAPVVTYLINTIVSKGTSPPTYLRRLHQQSFLIYVYGPYQSHRFCLALPRDLLFVNMCCLPYPLTNLPISSPSGSTTAALIATTHRISRLLESCSYVTCILIDYSKAFDTINHSILFRKFFKLPIPSNILLWIFNFLNDRMQAVFSSGHTSLYLATCYPKHRSRVWHWFVTLFDICIRPSHSVATKCHHQYADDTTLLVAQHSSTDIDQK